VAQEYEDLFCVAMPSLQNECLDILFIFTAAQKTQNYHRKELAAFDVQCQLMPHCGNSKQHALLSSFHP
jgi:hypothetical protein